MVSQTVRTLCSKCGEEAEEHDYTVVYVRGSWRDFCLRCATKTIFKILCNKKNVSTDGLDYKTKERLRAESIKKDFEIWRW